MVFCDERLLGLCWVLLRDVVVVYVLGMFLVEFDDCVVVVVVLDGLVLLLLE